MQVRIKNIIERKGGIFCNDHLHSTYSLASFSQILENLPSRLTFRITFAPTLPSPPLPKQVASAGCCGE